MSARTRAATFAPGLLLALVFCAGEAAAQDVCRGGPYTGATGAQIECVDTSGSTDIVIDPGSVNVARIHGDHRGAGDIIIRIKPGVTITGSGGNSVLASRRGTGDVSIVITGGTLTGIASSTSYGAPGTVSVSMSGGTLSGRLGAARNGGTGNAYVTVSGDATIRSTATNAYGVFATNNGLGDELSVRMTGGSVETTGSGSHGIFVNASNDNGATEGPAMSVDLEGGSVRTRGNAYGVFFASYRGSRDASFRMTGGSIVTEADNVHSVDFWLRRFATGQTASARMTGGSIVAEGLGGRGLASLELYYGSLDVMTGAGATIAAPFAVGMEGLLEVNASATGRLVFEHGGAVEARDVGVLARAARASGHTRGAGAQWADDTARTMPMIHVTSSGDVTVGASVSDAFIRNRIAGADETLSTGEQAVLSAITAGDSGDSDALTMALEALPDADYDADWKEEAQDLLRKRAASTGDGPLAHRAAEEILGLSRAGVRAYALSHTAIVDHVRAGNALSDAERAVLDAVLTKGVGSELEAALTALTGATYTTSWKNTVRQLAATYNAGDIQVDVTGGTIDAEGNGVEALYAVLHERNGAITVTVAEGARIVGGAKGVHVRGGGATGGVRNQRVTVNGRVRGGTGAGVYLGGGGTVSVGASGEVGATSGIGILADGGDLTATVSGTVTGDVRVDGGGDLTATVHAGGVVTGTLHDPQTPYTVGHRASIGRILYASGGTVTVSGGGKLTGVEGVAVESTGTADPLSVTVNDEGRVEGDLKSGGTLTANVMSGGVVTGTIHNPQASFTVGNRVSIGRILYASGGTVTVSGGGKLTGVEGVAVESTGTAGPLSVTVNDEGHVEGDLESGGTLTANVMSGGVVTGTIHNPQASFTVGNRVSIGRILYASGGTVTVSGDGKLTGVEGTAVKSTAGPLSVTVNEEGRVEGDLESGGTLTANVMYGGVVTGTIHNPQASFTVGNRASVGRILYASGGTVTVSGGGTLTGVGVEDVAVESTAGALSVTVNDEGRVEGDLKSGGTLTANVMSGGVVTGTIHNPQASFTVGNGVSIGRILYASGGTVTVAGTGKLTGVEVEGRSEAIRSEAGDLDVSVAAGGEVKGDVRARGDGDLRATVAGTVTGDVIEEGAGNLSATVTGTVTGDVLGRGAGEHTVTVSKGGTVTGTVHLAASTVRMDGTAGRVRFDNGGTVTVAGTGKLTGVEVEGRSEAIRSEAGDLDVSVAAGGEVKGDVRARGDGDLRAMVAGTLTGDVIEEGAGDLSTTVAGTLTGDLIEEGDGNLSATVTGTVTGDVLGRGAGEHTVTVSKGGTVTGTVHLAASTVRMDGTAGRVRFDNGGTVTVAGTGKLTGVEVEGRSEAIRSEAGDLDVSVAAGGEVKGDVRARGDGDLRAMVAGTVTGDVIEEGAGDLSATVTGTVTGDVLGRGAGEHTVTVSNGGTVTGTVHLAASTVRMDGTAGRVRFDNGGTVTVAGTGKLTGVEVEGRSEAIRSEAGDLDVSVAAGGEVKGDVRARGDGDLRAMVAGTLTGDVIEEGAGNLSATVTGTVTGDVLGRGAGEHTVTVSNGGTVTGTVHLAASTVRMDGTAGRVRFDNGGTVTVAGTGKLTGVEVEGRSEAIRSEAGDLDVSVAAGGEVKGDVRARGDGDLRAMVAGTVTGDVIEEGAGDLSATVTGTVTGDVLGRGAGEHTVTVSNGGTVMGSIDMAGAGSELRVDGTVEGRVRYRRGGMVTVGPDGRIEGRVSSDRGGELVAVAEVKPGETEAEALERAFPGELFEEGGTPTVQIRKEGEPARSVGALDTMDALVDGAWDVGMKRTESGAFRVERELAPRSRVYEALPSVVLGLNGLRGFRERMAAPRSTKGGWARVERFQGKWKADASTSGVKYRHRRHGVAVGLDGALGEEARFGASLHHRRGTAEVTEGGDVELYGTGAGVSGTWMRDEFYVDAQAAVTWYEADLGSSRRGVLKKDLSGHGHALGVEAGRRMELEHLPAGVVLTPRAGLVHSQVSMDAFSDSMGFPVKVDDARSLRGRAGVDVEAKPGGAPGSRVFASVEMEHELSTDRKVRVSGTEETELKSEAEATWLRLGLNGVYAWEEGRYTVQGGMSYATSGGSHELGGGLSLNLRF